MGGFDVLAAPFFAASAVLLWSGVAKLRDPSVAVDAIASTGWSDPPRTVARSIGAIEVMIGSAALVAPTPPVASAVAALYIVFALFVVRLLTGGVPAPTCGCAGGRAVGPSWLHVALNAAAAGVALSVAWIGAGLGSGIPGTLVDDPATGVVTALGAALIAWLAALAVTYVPSLVGSYQPDEPAVVA
jgi:uncharacterized membrane protein YphA (DoxX/SURF4 family)